MLTERRRMRLDLTRPGKLGGAGAGARGKGPSASQPLSLSYAGGAPRSSWRRSAVATLLTTSTFQHLIGMDAQGWHLETTPTQTLHRHPS